METHGLISVVLGFDMDFQHTDKVQKCWIQNKNLRLQPWHVRAKFDFYSIYVTFMFHLLLIIPVLIHVPKTLCRTRCSVGLWRTKLFGETVRRRRSWFDEIGEDAATSRGGFRNIDRQDLTIHGAVWTVVDHPVHRQGSGAPISRRYYLRCTPTDVDRNPHLLFRFLHVDLMWDFIPVNSY